MASGALFFARKQDQRPSLYPLEDLAVSVADTVQVKIPPGPENSMMVRSGPQCADALLMTMLLERGSIEDAPHEFAPFDCHIEEDARARARGFRGRDIRTATSVNRTRKVSQVGKSRRGKGSPENKTWAQQARLGGQKRDPDRSSPLSLRAVDSD